MSKDILTIKISSTLVGDFDGGGEQDRTDDLLRARQALSQLSYTPTFKKWWAWEDLNFRPHAYQACALAS